MSENATQRIMPAEPSSTAPPRTTQSAPPQRSANFSPTAPGASPPWPNPAPRKPIVQAAQAPFVLRRHPLGRFVVLDFETTGLNPIYGARVIEVSAREIVDGQLRSELCTLVDPGSEVPQEITSITGITTAMVRGKPRSAEVIGELCGFIADAPIIAHNAGFDLKFLIHESMQHCIALQSERHICTLLLARRVFPDHGSYKLGLISSALGIALPANMHRASADTYVTTLLFEKIYASAVDKSGGRFLELTTLEALQRIERRKVDKWLTAQGA